MSKSRDRRRRQKRQSARQGRHRKQDRPRGEIRTVDAQEFINKRIEHGARLVDDSRELVDEAEIIWSINPGEDLVSQLCVECLEFMNLAARNSGRAVELLEDPRTEGDHHRSTALKKYVEDTGQALKEIDNRLKVRGSSLIALFPELPKEIWRDLLARRNVIAHRILSVDDKRVREEAGRYFRDLYRLVRRIEFSPVMVNLKTGLIPGPQFKGSVLLDLPLVAPGMQPKLGEALIVVYETEKGVLALRFGRTNANTLAIASSIPGEFDFKLYKVQFGGDNAN
ncbi:MAG: hypothetical protein F4X41_00230 [Chloroflexi bacterium]|nr:hypothetical protein [Chloroflexota bacterium]